jgi:ribosomal protein L37AE/L43A
MSATGNRRSWDYPPCPECETDVLVAHTNTAAADWHCLGCGSLFSPDENADV